MFCKLANNKVNDKQQHSEYMYQVYLAEQINRNYKNPWTGFDDIILKSECIRTGVALWHMAC